MQEKQERQSNEARSQATRAALIAAARDLFSAKGYAGTGTPELVEAAGLTRGALYHHFEDKLALYRALVESEYAAIAAEIEAADSGTDPLQALSLGTAAFLQAMQKGNRTHMLLVEAPAVLGIEALEAIDRGSTRRTLREGLAVALGPRADELPLEALTDLLSAAFDRAAIAISRGGALPDYRAALDVLIESLVGRKPHAGPA